MRSEARTSPRTSQGETASAAASRASRSSPPSPSSARMRCNVRPPSVPPSGHQCCASTWQPVLIFARASSAMVGPPSQRRPGGCQPLKQGLLHFSRRQALSPPGTGCQVQPAGARRQGQLAGLLATQRQNDPLADVRATHGACGHSPRTATREVFARAWFTASMAACEQPSRPLTAWSSRWWVLVRQQAPDLRGCRPLPCLTSFLHPGQSTPFRPPRTPLLVSAC